MRCVVCAVALLFAIVLLVSGIDVCAGATALEVNPGSVLTRHNPPVKDIVAALDFARERMTETRFRQFSGRLSGKRLDQQGFVYGLEEAHGKKWLLVCGDCSGEPLSNFNVLIQTRKLDLEKMSNGQKVRFKGRIVKIITDSRELIETIGHAGLGYKIVLSADSLEKVR